MDINFSLKFWRTDLTWRLTFEPSQTGAGVAIGCIHTDPSIHTGIRVTFVDVTPAFTSTKPCVAHAVVSVHLVDTCALILTRVWGALVDVGLTLSPSIARWTDALKVPWEVLTGGATTAGVADTLVDINLTLASCGGHMLSLCFTIIGSINNKPTLNVWNDLG